MRPMRCAVFEQIASTCADQDKDSERVTPTCLWRQTCGITESPIRIKSCSGWLDLEERMSNADLWTLMDRCHLENHTDRFSTLACKRIARRF